LIQFCLDADWVINALAGRKGADSVLQGIGPDAAGVPIITLGELYEGPLGTSRPEQNLTSLREFLALFPVIDLNDGVMERFARLRRDLRNRGALIPDFDLVIASVSLEYDLTLLTFNTRHFERISGLRLYVADS